SDSADHLTSDPYYQALPCSSLLVKDNPSRPATAHRSQFLSACATSQPGRLQLSSRQPELSCQPQFDSRLQSVSAWTVASDEVTSRSPHPALASSLPRSNCQTRVRLR